MTKIDIFSGFLGAGKTTLIKKLIEEAYRGESLVLIENEFGEIGIDGGFLQEAGIRINEMNSGCICCSLVGDFTKALSSVLDEFSPDRILIEPSGVGKLSDVIRAASGVDGTRARLNSFTTVVDAGKCKMYMKNFGEFFNDQVRCASTILFSRTDTVSEEKIEGAVKLLREHNTAAAIVTTPWSQLDGKEILRVMEEGNSLEDELEALLEEQLHHHEHAQHEHHYDEDGNCACGHHHDHEHEHEHHHEHEHEHHHEHEHEHHHEHEHEREHHEHHYDEHGNCSCGHHHHHADEVFGSFGAETSRKFTEEEIRRVLDTFTKDTSLGTVLRAKGIVASDGDEWIYFDYVPGECDVRRGAPAVIGKLCVIGSDLSREGLYALFGI